MCDQTVPVTPRVLADAMQRELDGVSRLTHLTDLAEDAADAVLLRQIHNDGTRHLSALASLYRRLTGTEPPALQPERVHALPYGEGVRESVPQKLQDSEFYRCIALHCGNPATGLFSDMAQDESRHAVLFNHLYLRWIERRCCTPDDETTCDGIVHQVQPGDSLWLIAQRYAVPMEALLEANPQITDPGSILPGQVLCIPCGGIVYTVRPGDSLWLIAREHGLSVEELQGANPLIADPGALQVGQVLCIPVSTPPRESLVYLYGRTAQQSLSELDGTRDALTAVSPDAFALDESGNLLLASSQKFSTGFVDELHRRGLQVIPFLSNHWNREVGVNALSNREMLTSQLADAVGQYGLDGVNFDLENLTEAHRAAYVDLVRLMREKLPEDKVLSVAVAANPNGWQTGWHGSYDYADLARYCDYLVVMAYDESYQGGPEGPVSSASFFEDSIRYALDQGVPREKLIIGLPFFGRYWKEGDSLGGLGIADRDVEFLLDNYAASVRYDEDAASALAVVTIRPEDSLPTVWGGRVLTPGTYRIWYDNMPATRRKLEIVDSYDLLGAAGWALGQENPAIWDFYAEALGS